MNMAGRGLMITTVALFYLSGCEGAPVQKAEDAKRAVEAARRAEAEKYAAQEFAQLEDSLKAGLIELDRQNAQFGLFRDYAAARHALEWVDAHADQIGERAQENKERLKRVTKDLIELAGDEVNSAALLVAKVPRRQDSGEEIASFKNDLKSLRSSLQEMATELEAENFADAQLRAKAVQTRAERLQREARAVLARNRALSPARGRR